MGPYYIEKYAYECIVRDRRLDLTHWFSVVYTGTETQCEEYCYLRNRAYQLMMQGRPEDC